MLTAIVMNKNRKNVNKIKFNKDYTGSEYSSFLILALKQNILVSANFLKMFTKQTFFWLITVLYHM